MGSRSDPVRDPLLAFLRSRENDPGERAGIDGLGGVGLDEGPDAQGVDRTSPEFLVGASHVEVAGVTAARAG